MTDAKSNHVEKVAAKFGPYLADFAKGIQRPYTTVNSWVIRGSIPEWCHTDILAAAKRLGIKLVKRELEKPKAA